VHKFNDVAAAFAEIEQWLGKGYHVAGGISYETGYTMDYVESESGNTCGAEGGAGSEIGQEKFPLIFLYVFNDPYTFNHKTGQCTVPVSATVHGNDIRLQSNQYYKVSNFRLNVSQSEYVRQINRIKRYIAAGDTYQVNYTLKSRFDFTGYPAGLYKHLRNTQKVAYASYLKTSERTILSFSPELFFRKTGDSITMRPMKGTIKRGMTFGQDEKLGLELYHSKKNRAENVMIVDLIRNDLGRISVPASVKTVSLFDIEKYETLYQMTSTIIATLNPGIRFYDLFNSIFPSGSVTGAPKIRTMQIINKLEKEPRHVYTGAIGFITPSRDAVFNVPIRTVIVHGQYGELGIGSGITYDSDPVDEYNECKLKSLFLTKPAMGPFQLVESMLWENATDKNHWHGYYLFNEHADRLAGSAAYFGIELDLIKIREKLAGFVKKFDKTKQYKVRLLVDQSGKPLIEFNNVGSAFMTPVGMNLDLKVVLSPTHTDPTDVFLYHKTTLRELYHAEYEKYSKQGYFDVLYMNNKNEITEFSRGNIIIKKGNKFYTPPISCGLLAGVYRQHFIDRHKNLITEKILKLKDIRSADKIYFTNAVRKLREVKLDC
jgi:para-aminobenzoate synthetase/4-amino-4-deoxychorismate lyase